MSATKTTPGVYIEEISKFPPSVAAVKTAIPAFVGYTEKAGKNNDLYNKPIRIASMLDYETLFGGAPAMEEIQVSLDTDNLISKIEPKPAFYLFHSLQLFFANGGGACFIVTVGNYSDSISESKLITGIALLEIEDEPTLLDIPDACLLSTRAECIKVYTAMLDQCEKLQDRFAILNIFDNDTPPLLITTDVVKEFRNDIPSNSNLKYGAAYYPFVRTSISIPFNHAMITGFNWLDTITDANSVDIFNALNQAITDLNDHPLTVKSIKGLLFANKDTKNGSPKLFENIDSILADSDSWRNANEKAKKDDTYKLDGTEKSPAVFTIRKLVLDKLISKIKAFSSLESYKPDGSTVDENALSEYFTNLKSSTGALGKLETAITAAALDEDKITGYFNQAMTILENLYEYAISRVKYLEDQLTLNNGFYAYIRQSVESQGLILPPSAMMAGVYARVDNLRGVWKAPANVGLNMVIAPTVKISHTQHGELNVDSSGKSINAIRSYIGKGNMVMGARTLAGNSNEWRYISVRRLFIFVEESVQEACEQFLFEPNDANTWVNVKGMINNFLYNLWRDGALAGAKAGEAYYVKIGLPETMTAQDILEGVMNVEIGLAAVRPAEFIVLKFSHKLQTS